MQIPCSLFPLLKVPGALLWLFPQPGLSSAKLQAKNRHKSLFVTQLAESFSCRPLQKEQGSAWTRLFMALHQTTACCWHGQGCSGRKWSAAPGCAAGHSTLHPKERVGQMDRQPASVLKDKEKVQDSCLAEGWPQTMPKQTAYKKEKFKTQGYTLHTEDSTEDSL